MSDIKEKLCKCNLIMCGMHFKKLRKIEWAVTPDTSFLL